MSLIRREGINLRSWTKAKHQVGLKVLFNGYRDHSKEMVKGWRHSSVEHVAQLSGEHVAYHAWCFEVHPQNQREKNEEEIEVELKRTWKSRGKEKTQFNLYLESKSK